jgi:DNA repair photolyase
MKSKLVFLGGTVGNNSWRKGFVETLVSQGIPADIFFDPVVNGWGDEAREREKIAKNEASHFIFYIADPQQEGNRLSAYSMVEATIALNDAPTRTVVVFDSEGMDGRALKIMNKTLELLKARFPEANIFGTRQEAIDWFSRSLA